MSRRPGATINKDPSSVEPQGFDWTDYLAELGAGVTISTSTWAVTPTGLTVAAGSIVTGSLKTQTTLSSGTVGVLYTVTNQIITSTSVTDERSFFVRVAQR